MEYKNTRLTGYCTGNKQALEEQQADALRTLLVPLLNADVDLETWKNRWSILWLMMYMFLHNSGSDGFGGYPFENNKFKESDDRGSISFVVGVKDTVVYMEHIHVTGAGLDLTVLPDLVSKLPRLRSFTCMNCSWNSKAPGAMQLPAELAARAPKTLTKLQISGSKAQGSLPAEWGQWPALTFLDLSGNELTGTLPASWKAMKSVRTLNIANNLLQGTLPSVWGYGGIARASELHIDGNQGLTGTIPATWSMFKGAIYASNTGLAGCLPDKLMTSVFWDTASIPCSDGSSELADLVKLRNLLDPSGLVLRSWDQGDGEFAHDPGKQHSHHRVRGRMEFQ